jgi:Arc/MetJ family transcription regulator
MKHRQRMNFVLDQQLLDEAMRLAGERTYSRTIERALEDFVRRAKARQMLNLRGSGLWEGDLDEMRRVPRPAPRKGQRLAR